MGTVLQMVLILPHTVNIAYPRDRPEKCHLVTLNLNNLSLRGAKLRLANLKKVLGFQVHGQTLLFDTDSISHQSNGSLLIIL